MQGQGQGHSVLRHVKKIITIIYPQDRFNQPSFGRFLAVHAWTADSCHLFYV